MSKRKILSLILVMALMLSAVCDVSPQAEAATVEVWDGKALSEPEQDNGVYQISNGAELAWFADHVNQLCSQENGLVKVDAVLTDDIYLGDQSWTPIGETSYIVYAYGGTFDGQNHTVSGLKIDATAADYGLFSKVNTGTIKNLKVKGDVHSTSVVGGVIGKLHTGTVENCSMEGSVISEGKSTKGYAGGIVGTINSTGDESKIKGCCNKAEVSGTYAGGILGCHNANKVVVEISNCYNTGAISGSSRSGGIAGQHQKGSMSYCYSIGKSKNGICGFSNAEVTNCYYLAANTQDDMSAPGGTQTGTGYETITDAAALLTNLNAGAEKLFEEDKNNINDGYPVLSWQLSAAVVSVPVVSAGISGDAVTGGTLVVQALGEDDQSATNVKCQWAVSEDKITFTDIEGATELSFRIPDTREYAGKYIKVSVVGEQGSTASAVSGPVAKSDSLIYEENNEAVQAAVDALSLETSVVKEAGRLALPTEVKGCAVSWGSSHPDLIGEDGTVTLPAEGIVTVTLTATVSCGAANSSKQMKIDVWAADVNADAYLEKVLESMKWDFKLLQPVFGRDTNILIRFKEILAARGFDGVAVTIGSTEDESLISKNGKIYYPAIPDGGSMADGRQVKVIFHLTVDGKTVDYPTSNNYALLIPWDTGSVKTALEQSADKVMKESVLCADGDSFSAVSSDLTLPSCVDEREAGKTGRYSFAWITWESSDESHLSISNENRQNGADSLYNPYIGKIQRDDREHAVTLTATFRNPSTDVTVVRTVEVATAPLSGEQIEQTTQSMRKLLDCYTPEKLLDAVTKEQLDTSSVYNDIQLVIPRNVVTKEELAGLDYGEYWDYWNYQFTVTSSDTDVIDINSFRANVYRPLGEDASADRKVVLTVRMTLKANPNLFVEKEIEVTVRHLGRAEINRSLALMDQAKTSYADGLLGNNADCYSVIDDLTPYREIVWNADESGVDFIYQHADMERSGIMVDELPGWEAQEDWRLFRTSNKDLVSNETLILNETPEEDTFVKINSVLTDEILGKYYVKFQDDEDYDKEALAKFRQLYKQPVSVCMVALGAGAYTESFAVMKQESKALFFSAALSAYRQETEQPISVSFTLLGVDGEVLIPKTQENSFTAGATVYDVFQKALSDHDIPYLAKGSYIRSINGLAEYEYGDNSGWMYTVGDVFVNSYMNAQELLGGEDIVVKYVKDYKAANPSWKETASPKPTGTPAAVPTVKPTQTPEPTGTPAVIATEAPTGTPKPMETTPTVKPTQTPEPMETTPASKPTATPEPMGTPMAVPTVEPTQTFEPTGTPTGVTESPRPTLAPTETPKPIETTPAIKPTETPAAVPTVKPTESPAAETQSPDITPTPTGTPTAVPTVAPTETPKPTETVSDNNQPGDSGNTGKESVGRIKRIKTLKLKKYKRGTKKIVGKTIKKSRITVWVGRKRYMVKSNAKGKFVVKTEKKLVRKQKIKITVSKTGYQRKTKVFRVK